MRFDRIYLFFDHLFDAIGGIFLSFIRRLAPYAVPLAPAFFLGHAVYTAAAAISSPTWGMAVGISAAIGLEAAGIRAPDLALRLYRQQNRSWLVAAFAVVAYLAIGITIIWLLENTSQNAKLTATAMFLVAGLVYLIMGLEESHKEQAQRTAEAQALQAAALTTQAQTDLELQRLAMQLKTEEKIARINAKAQQAAAQPAPAPPQPEAAQARPQPVPEYDQELASIRQDHGGQTLGIADWQALTEKGKTATYDLINYGMATDQVAQAARGKFTPLPVAERANGHH